MNPEKRVKAYAKRNFNEVYHCTLNPDGPGVVRIFLVPPLVDDIDLDSNTIDDIGSGRTSFPSTCRGASC